MNRKKLKKLSAALSVILSTMISSQGSIAAFADEFYNENRENDSSDDDIIVEKYDFTPTGEPSQYGLISGAFLNERGENYFDSNPVICEKYASSSFPAYYNLEKLGRVTSVKNQNPFGTCWAFAVMGSSESTMISSGYANNDIDFSESHLIWFTTGACSANSDDPLYNDGKKIARGNTCWAYGGNSYMACASLAAGRGYELEMNFPYNAATDSAYNTNIGKITDYTIPENNRYNSYAHLREWNMLGVDTNAVKAAIMQNGACTVNYYHGGNATTGVLDDDVYNSKTGGYYQPETTDVNHGVTVIGWDDNFSKDNFTITPPGDGAWIIKNSWGPNWGKDGYLYISYFDPSLQDFSQFCPEPVGAYDDIYQYDGSLNSWWSAECTYSTFANVFTAADSDPISAVGFYTMDASVKYTVQVVTGVTGSDFSTGTLMSEKTGVIDFAGYHTIKLNNLVKINKGENFAVIVRLEQTNSAIKSSPCVVVDDYNCKSGVSYTSYSNSERTYKDFRYFKDTYSGGYNVALKAYSTKETDITPDKPAVAATAGDGKVTLKWNSVGSGASYKIYSYNKSTKKYASIATTSNTTYTVSGLKNGTEYGYLVRANINGSLSPYTVNDVVYATPIGNTPAKPVVTASAGNGSVTLKWNSIGGNASYKIYSYDKSKNKYASIDTTTATSYTVTGLKNGTKYGFLVRANINGTLSPYTADDVVYAAPVGTSKPVVTASAGNKTVTLKWNSVGSGASYKIYSYNKSKNKYTSIDTTTATSYTVTNLTNGTKYGFLVRASVNGTLSAYTADDVVYATPSGAGKPVVTAAAGNKTVTLKWNSVSSATSYKIYSYDKKTKKYASVTTVTGTSYTVTGLENGKEYGFLVRANVNGTMSPYTDDDVVYATPKA